MSAFWSKLKGFFVKVGQVFITIFGKEAATEFATGAVAILKTSAGKIALDAVESQLGKNTSNDEKRQSAGEQIVNDLKSQGVTIETGMANLLLETALNFIKGHFGDHGVEVPAPAPVSNEPSPNQ